MAEEVKRDNLTDRELVEASLADASAYAGLVERYQSPLRRYVRRLGCRDADDAEDILQEIFIKVYLNLNGFDRQLKFSSWIYRIAHNETVTFFRRAKIRPRTAVTEEEAIMIEQVSADLDIGRETDRKLEAETIRTALDRLDDKYRQALTLKFLEEKSYQEISDILEKPMGTVATLINRAKAKLKKELADRQAPAETVWEPTTDSPTA